MREGDRKHISVVGARKFSEVTKCFSKFMTRCHLNNQSLDKRVINHAFSDGFTIVNFAFILPPLLTQQTCVYHGKVRKAGHIEKPIYHGKLSFTMVKKLKCDLNHYYQEET